MTPNDWAALAVAATTLVGTLAVTVRHLVKHYLPFKGVEPVLWRRKPSEPFIT